jgi:uncharacterized delta-60 repeat protein
MRNKGCVPRPARILNLRRGFKQVSHTPPFVQCLEPRVLWAAGDFDPSFGGGDGGAVVDFATTGTDADFARAMAVDPATGKIVLAGTTGGGGNTDDRIALARLKPDGSPDPSFDGDGLVAFPVLAPSDVEVTDVAISPLDGKIVVVGDYRDYSSGSGALSDWLIARFNPDGSIDKTFDGDGIVILDGGSHFGDTLYGVTVQSDGKIVATGVATQATSNLATLRFNDNGSPDLTFNGTGKSIVDFFGGVDFASDVLYQPDDGKIVVAGGSVVPNSYRRFVLLRYNANGSPDNTFDGDGRASTDFGQSAFGRDVLRQPDGKYVVGGLFGSGPSGRQYYAFARYNPNGSPDSSFGTNAAVPGTTTVTSVAGFTFASYGIARQPNGAILFAGSTFDESFNSNAVVIRLTPAGVPDPAWDGDGVRLYTAPGTSFGDSNGVDVALAPDGNILVAGYTFGSTVDFVAMKLQSGVDVTPPAVNDAAFEYANRQGVRLTFSEDLGESVDLDDLRLERLGSPNQTFPPLFVNFNFGGGLPTTATWYYGTSETQLPDGNYRATLKAGSVRDLAGNALAADYVFDFFVLAGDANRDRKVDFSDLVTLAQNYGATGKDFSTGDFNYDTAVDFQDLVILAQHYNTSLPAPAGSPVFGTAALDLSQGTGRSAAAKPLAALFSAAVKPKPAKPARPRVR